MASKNVEKCLGAAEKQPSLTLEVFVALAKVQEAAGVRLSKQEAKEFVEELAKAEFAARPFMST